MIVVLGALLMGFNHRYPVLAVMVPVPEKKLVVEAIGDTCKNLELISIVLEYPVINGFPPEILTFEPRLIFPSTGKINAHME